MISEKLTKAIEKEGQERGYYMESAGGVIDESGKFKFIITLANHVQESPPPLGVHIQDGVGTGDKVGG
jgi:hypothetical protein